MNLLHITAISILFVLYVEAFYNIPIVVAGAKHLRHERRKKSKKSTLSKKLPSVSIVVPVKNEEIVIDRLLGALTRLNYPQEKTEIVIVEDGSVDVTAEICREYVRQYPDQIRLIHQLSSTGKPAALNYALKHVRGEIVAVFDADSVPDPDALLNAVKYFQDSSVAAVQGRTRSINPDQNVLTKFASYEEGLAFNIYLQGRDALDLFVPLAGSCYFIRKSVIEQVHGWDDESLSEDVEMSVRLALTGHRIKYAPDVRSWQETTASGAHLIGQRMRWFRGNMEVALKYGKLVTKPNRRNVDIEFTLAGSFIFPLCLLGLIIALYGFLVPIHLDPVSQVIVNVASLLTVILFLATGTVLVYVTNLQKRKNLRWLPLTYLYWVMETFIATCALTKIILKRPRKWEKTVKTGVTTSSSLNTREHPAD